MRTPSDPKPRPRRLRGAPAGFERPFVGREADVSALVAATREHGKLALWGPPGVGKTRLALEVAGRLLDDPQPDDAAFERATFCALDAADNREDIIAMLARMLDVPVRSGSVDRALGVLTRWVAEHAVLVVFDNAEGLLDETVDLARHLAQASPASTFVVTTRHAPQHESVWAYHVEPLTVSEGVALLRARADHLDDVAPEILEAIVSRLDGLPMSIELAAGRLPIFSCRQLLERLENQLEMLQDYDDRQLEWEATLLRSLDASWPLLSDVERTALAQCSVFRGDFSLESAEAILALPEGSSAGLVIQGLTRKSLVYSVGRPADAQQRFRLYESVREYAARQLDIPTRQRVVERLVSHFGRRLRHHSRGLYSPETLDHIEAMHAEFANARFALLNAAAGRPADVAALARGLLQFVRIAAPFRDLRALVAQALAHIEQTGSPAAEAELLVVLAKFETIHSQQQQAQQYAQQAAHLAQTHGLVALFAEAKTLLGFFEIRFQRLDEAEEHLREAQQVLDGQGLHRLSGALHTDLGLLCLQRGDPEQAHPHFRQSLVLHNRCNNPRFASTALFNLGAVECARARFEQALERFQEAYEQWDAWGDQHRRGVGLLCVGQCHLALGHGASARESLESALGMAEEFGERVLVAEISSWLGLAYAAVGEPGRATSRSDEAIGLVELLGSDEQAVVFHAHRVILEFALGGARVGHNYLQRADEFAQSTADGPHLGALGVARQFVERVTGEATDAPACSIVSGAMEQHEVMPFAAVADHFLSGKLGEADLADSTPALQVGVPQADWFEWDNKHVDLSRRDAARGILTRLVSARLDQPGEAVSKEQILAAGWPGAVLHPEAAASRIYTEIRKLRDAGLREVLLTRDGGYLLDPKLAVVCHKTKPGEVLTSS